MKPFITLFICFLFILPCYTQVSWFPVGAKWHYEYSSFLSYGITTLEVLADDTIIGPHTYAKILSTTSFVDYPDGLDTFTELLYAYEENNIVIGYDHYLGSQVLYDFNAAENDTLEYMRFGGFSPSPFVVDSVGIIEMNGSDLTFQDIKFPSLYDPGQFYTMRVIEGIGSINSHLFSDHTIIQPFDAPFYYFRCYEDPSIGLINLSYDQVECDYIDGITSNEDIQTEKVSIHPNPAIDLLTIELNTPASNKVSIADILGNIRVSALTNQQSSIEMDVSDLESGLFFIIIEDKSGKQPIVKKFVKQSN